MLSMQEKLDHRFNSLNLLTALTEVKGKRHREHEETRAENMEKQKV